VVDVQRNYSSIIIHCVFLTNLFLNPHLHIIARSKLSIYGVALTLFDGHQKGIWPAKGSLLRNSAKLAAVVENYKQGMTSEYRHTHTHLTALCPGLPR